jgi:hypothetical protein
MDSPYVAGFIKEMQDNHHNVQRVYPFLAAGVTVTSSGSAYTLGSISEIVPTGTNEVNTLTITHSCDVVGNISINLDGERYTIPLVTGNIASVAAQIRDYYAYIQCRGKSGRWVVTGSGNDIIFTKVGLATTGVLQSAGSTAVTGSFVKTTTGAGIGSDFSIRNIQLGAISKAGTWIIQLYKGATGTEEVIVTEKVTTATDGAIGGIIPIITPIIGSGARISAAVANSGSAGGTVVMSVGYGLY